MPRRATRSQISVRRKRRPEPAKFRLHKAEWVDPFPLALGTSPEKRIFAELVRRRIYFIFQGDWPVADRNISVLAQARFFKPDFIVPEWKVIYDPFSEFHHTQPDALKSDFYKQQDYEGKGYEFVHSWSLDVDEKGGHWAVDQSVRIHGAPLQPLKDAEDIYWKRVQGYRIGPNVGLGASSVGIANKRRKRYPSLALGTPRGR